MGLPRVERSEALPGRQALIPSSMLESRAGEPAWGVQLLAREQLIGGLESLGPFFNDWERWAADLTETHVNDPWLLAGRACSQRPAGP